MESDPGPASPHLSPRLAQVVPDVASFAVDDGFAYRVPPGVNVEVGSMVRVPLGARKVRGFVTALHDRPRSRLRDIQSVSGDLAVFSEPLLRTLRWAALHYVAPLSRLLARAAPPNLPLFADEAPEASQDRRAPNPVFLLGNDLERGLAAAKEELEHGRSTLVVMPTVAEAAAAASAAERALGPVTTLSTSSLGAAVVTDAWVRSATAVGVLVATRESAFWPVFNLGLAIVFDEGRRGHKEKRTPTTHTREVLRHRSQVERFGLMLTGLVPTGEALSAGNHIERPGRRLWPLVEIADRTLDPPGTGPVSDAAKTAIKGVVKAGGRVFVFARRRGYAAAFRCVDCRELRDCAVCGAGAARSETCPRCETKLGACRKCGGERFEPLGFGMGRIIDELRGLLGDRHVGDVTDDAAVVVGTERDLPALGTVQLAVVLDADGLLLAPSYRAQEDGLRLMARVAATVERGRGKRCLVQTSQPSHPVVASLKRGDPVEFLDADIRERAAAGFPPGGELLLIEAANQPPNGDAQLREAGGSAIEVLGPVEAAGRKRWLVQGAELNPFRIALRPLVQTWRDGGAKVRIDADPMDI